MSDRLKKYNVGLEKRRIPTWIPPNNIPGPKFYPNGDAKPFYGLTCIARIEPESDLFGKLCDLQERFREEFEQARLGSLFTFLTPESFHMTVCDIDADPDPTQIQLDDRIEQVQKAFDQIGKPEKVTSLVRGIGLKQTITALVRFDHNPEELEKVRAMELKIKKATGKNVRDFTGHVSLAYLVQHPGDDTHKIKEILFPYEKSAFGEYVFSQVELTRFKDMNTYTPLLTIDLKSGTVTCHHEPRNT